MFNIVEKRRWYFIASATLIGLGMVAMVVSTIRFGAPVRLHIDFTGGSLCVLKFQEAVSEDGIRAVLADFGHENPIVQRLGAQEEHTWQVRTRFAEAEEVQAILAALDERVGRVDRDVSTFDVVQPAIGDEVTRAAGLAILIASLIILAFIWFSFRRVPHAFRYGVCTIVGMLHNLLVVFGFYALMGFLAGWEVDALFLTAVLTVIGFSVQDVIVVFDRIRENIPKHKTEPYERVVNRSILETIHRSLATQLNAIFVMIAIIMFGGQTIKPFVATMLVGMMSETYSAIFIAVPLLAAWEGFSARRAAAVMA